MRGFEYSAKSDLTSELNQLRYNEWLGRRLVRYGNKGLIDRNKAMSLYSRARTALLHYLHGRPERHLIDAQTRIQGIPCGIHVTGVTRGSDWGVPKNPLMPDERPDADEYRYIVTDRRGYRAKWLEAKMTLDDDDHVQRLLEGKGL